MEGSASRAGRQCGVAARGVVEARAEPASAVHPPKPVARRPAFSAPPFTHAEE